MALPAIRTWAVKPCLLGNRGEANPGPSAEAQVVLTRLGGLTWEGGGEKKEGRRMARARGAVLSGVCGKGL